MARARRSKPGRARNRGTKPRHPQRGTGTGTGGDTGRRERDALATIPRIALVDWLRGAALIGMTVFHFAYDLEFFGGTGHPALRIAKPDKRVRE